MEMAMAANVFLPIYFLGRVPLRDDDALSFNRSVRRDRKAVFAALH